MMAKINKRELDADFDVRDVKIEVREADSPILRGEREREREREGGGGESEREGEGESENIHVCIGSL